MLHVHFRRIVLVLAACCTYAACDRAPHTQDVVTDEASPARLARMVRSMMPRLERLSGLDRVEMVRVREQDRDAVRNYVAGRLEEEMPADELEGVRATYAILGLVPDTLDLRALLLDLYTEQVLGYYDPATRTLYVLRGADGDALEPVMAHELVHALQDQHTNLDSLIARERGNDRQTAAHAAMEGHAMVVMFAFLAELATRGEVDPASLPSPARELAPALAAQNEQFPVFRRAPRIIRETLLFPYIDGADFVHTLWVHRRGVKRYPAPLDSLLPQSTQQVIDPVERFIDDRVEPIELRYELPEGVDALYGNTLGQLEIGIFLAQHLGDDARQTASGWRGDRFVIVRDVSGDGMVWTSLWESPDAAGRFADAVRRTLSARPGRNVAIETTELDGVSGVRITDTSAGTRNTFRERLAAVRAVIR